MFINICIVYLLFLIFLGNKIITFIYNEIYKIYKISKFSKFSKKVSNIDKLQKIIEKIKLAESGKAKIVLDTNMYIFWYEFQLDIYKLYDIKTKNKLSLVNAIFKYLEKKQIKIILLNVINKELKYKFKEKRYYYSKDILFGKLNIEIEKDNSKENKELAKKLFPEEQHDMIIYLYCRDENIEIVITNDSDFNECEKRYEQKITKKEGTIITRIPEFIEAINEIEAETKH